MSKSATLTMDDLLKDQKEIEKVIGDLSAYLERVEVIYD